MNDFVRITEDEFTWKLNLVRTLLQEQGLAGILLTQQNNLSWLTGGRSFVGMASESGCFSLLITPEKVGFLAANNEAPRLLDEELEGLLLEQNIFPWYDVACRERQIAEVAGSGKVKTDLELANAFSQFRAVLHANELEKLRRLGKNAAAFVEEICCGIKPGMSELQVAGQVAARCWEEKIEPATVLVGSDERLLHYRHPLPTAKKIEKHCMVAVCLRQNGLFVSFSRLVHFGPIPDCLRQSQNAVARIEAQMISSTRPGILGGRVVQAGIDIYRETGFAEEWKNHHQGGRVGYAARESRCTVENSDIVTVNQAYAWNPSVPGAKSEDTFLVLPDGNEIITQTGKYPTIAVPCSDRILLRPDILVL